MIKLHKLDPLKKFPREQVKILLEKDGGKRLNRRKYLSVDGRPGGEGGERRLMVDHLL